MQNKPRIPRRHELPSLSDDDYYAMIDRIQDMYVEGLQTLRVQRDKAELENTLLKTALVKTLDEEDCILCCIDLSDVPNNYERVTTHIDDRRVYFTVTELSHDRH